jgi:hypothetical protein
MPAPHIDTRHISLEKRRQIVVVAPAIEIVDSEVWGANPPTTIFFVENGIEQEFSRQITNLFF